jgi:hypothetical protein
MQLILFISLSEGALRSRAADDGKGSLMWLTMHLILLISGWKRAEQQIIAKVLDVAYHAFIFIITGWKGAEQQMIA